MRSSVSFHGIAACHARFRVPLLWQQLKTTALSYLPFTAITILQSNLNLETIFKKLHIVTVVQECDASKAS